MNIWLFCMCQCQTEQKQTQTGGYLMKQQGGARQRACLSWVQKVFVWGSFARSVYPSLGSGRPERWQFAEAEKWTSKRGVPPATEHGNKKRTDSQTWMEINLNTNTPALTYATLSTFSALHQIGNEPFFPLVQCRDLSRSFFSSAVSALSCVLQVMQPLSLTWPRWERKRRCKNSLGVA